MSPPVAEQIIRSIKLIMGMDGTTNGKKVWSEWIPVNSFSICRCLPSARHIALVQCNHVWNPIIMLQLNLSKHMHTHTNTYTKIDFIVKANCCAVVVFTRLCEWNMEWECFGFCFVLLKIKLFCFARDQIHTFKVCDLSLSNILTSIKLCNALLYGIIPFEYCYMVRCV